ncbi:MULTISPECIES: hypothetical protein [Halorubrum]|uniref:DUF3311 domain-containing protein n=1 Tax=Halorubrum cibi TaxID=413815 RepID=A0A521DCB0_9EURY|nr:MULTISPECIES: hypothetical protein [Halorubrum]SMO68781.1 hypothetical protein SAMN06264867_106170 [Halorubrum cibi]
MRRSRDLLWIPTFALLVAFAVPWPLWGSDRVVAGLPAWIWWHVGWLGLCALAFRAFVRSGAWERGMGIDAAERAGEADATVDGGDRR